jgi:DNA-directed RNA polymerase specialized sigma24 family protein
VTRVLGRLVDHRTEPPPDDTYLRGEMRREVWAALGELSVDARTALLLAAHGFSGREVAEALGRTELATRSLICRARLRLRERLEGTEVLA